MVFSGLRILKITHRRTQIILYKNIDSKFTGLHQRNLQTLHQMTSFCNSQQKLFSIHHTEAHQSEQHSSTHKSHTSSCKESEKHCFPGRPGLHHTHLTTVFINHIWSKIINSNVGFVNFTYRYSVVHLLLVSSSPKHFASPTGFN